jgi:hypothetical protein
VVLGAGLGVVRVLTCLVMAWRLVITRTRAKPRFHVEGLWVVALALPPAAMLTRIGLGLPRASPARFALVLGLQRAYALFWTMYLRRSARVRNTYDPKPVLVSVFD